MLSSRQIKNGVVCPKKLFGPCSVAPGVQDFSSRSRPECAVQWGSGGDGEEWNPGPVNHKVLLHRMLILAPDQVPVRSTTAWYDPA